MKSVHLSWIMKRTFKVSTGWKQANMAYILTLSLRSTKRWPRLENWQQSIQQRFILTSTEIQCWIEMNTINTLSYKITTSKLWEKMRWRKYKLRNYKSIIRFNNSSKMLERCYQVMVQVLMLQKWCSNLKKEWTLTSTANKIMQTVPKNHHLATLVDS